MEKQQKITLEIELVEPKFSECRSFLGEEARLLNQQY